MKTKINSKKILVIGDVILDVYYTGNINRISPEAPVPVFLKDSERYVLGGAANVAKNLKAAGQEVILMSVIGNDENGKKTIQALENADININYLYSYGTKTTTKIRLLAENHQQVLRIDEEIIDNISEQVCNQLVSDIEAIINDIDLVVISDYLKGLLTVNFLEKVMKISSTYNKKVIIDVKDKDIKKYSNAFLLKPNLKELNMLTGMSVNNEIEIKKAAKYLLNSCKCEYILVTCGSKGMILVGKNSSFIVKAIAKEVFDVTGAGDTTLAYLAVGIVNTMPMNEAVKMANCAAALQVTKVGTSAVKLEEVIDTFIEHNYEKHIYSVGQEEELIEKLKGKNVVFTNGCFDILHVGHISYLEEAAKLGDVLVVGLNSDSSIRHLKGNNRPINTEYNRAKVLISLECVDYVILFDDDTPLNLISKVQPNTLVKGGDYKIDNIVGSDLVKNNGGKVIVLPFVEGVSTTKIIEEIRKDSLV